MYSLQNNNWIDLFSMKRKRKAHKKTYNAAIEKSLWEYKSHVDIIPQAPNNIHSFPVSALLWLYDYSFFFLLFLYRRDLHFFRLCISFWTDFEGFGVGLGGKFTRKRLLVDSSLHEFAISCWHDKEIIIFLEFRA